MRVSRETLYRTLSRRGNPQLKSLAAILGAAGLRLSVAAAQKVKPNILALAPSPRPECD